MATSAYLERGAPRRSRSPRSGVRDANSQRHDALRHPTAKAARVLRDLASPPVCARLRRWRLAVFDGGLDRGLIPRDSGHVKVPPGQRAALERHHAKEREEQKAEVARLNARIRQPEDRWESCRALALDGGARAPTRPRRQAVRPVPENGERHDRPVDRGDRIATAGAGVVGSVALDVALPRYPRPSVVDPVPHAERAYRSRLSLQDRQEVAERISAGWADGTALGNPRLCSGEAPASYRTIIRAVSPYGPKGTYAVRRRSAVYPRVTPLHSM